MENDAKGELVMGKLAVKKGSIIFLLGYINYRNVMFCNHALGFSFAGFEVAKLV